MDTVICESPGRLICVQRETPARQADEVLIRIRRVGICGTDMHIFRGTQPYLSYPRVMGHELSGEVAEAPAGSALKPGDTVYIMPYMSCGHCAACRKGRANCCMNIQVLGVHRDGGLTEYLSVPQAFVFRAEGIGLDEAAMLEFLAIGCHSVRRAHIKPGQRVLVVGVGPIGMATAVFAKLRGAEVTVLDSQTSRIDFCRQTLGMDHGVRVSPTTRDELSARTGGDFYDAVFDATGSPRAIEAGFAYVGHGGSYVLISVVAADITFNDPEFHKRETTLLGSRNATIEDFQEVLDAIRADLIPTRALNTHRTTLRDLPDVLPGWTAPEAGVIKALVEV
ncbi:zinc-binding alcohol dehydrogenase family protein [Asticcacaulis sp. AND118]|uniref:zinc-binding alcohol dehydrogenase family protein n=1 Tax=Asticcacaulis sp. AND118 TaxID=2840468 RepID=UPI001CFFF866|nr:zinc-binding alcohol dehydrogenase family protein [Asticcacaulis sp. AND118]UDF05557.1 zinc-binding alcohol dehydrogenase family protein [Asticcacaulis sp. AND118]